MKGSEVRRLTGCGSEYTEGSVVLPNVLPLLVVSRSSWRDVLRRLPEKETAMTIERFRGNIVLDGGAPWEEDSYAALRITPSSGDDKTFFDLSVVGRCMRCPVPTIDPSSNVKHASGEPIKTMSKFRRIDKGSPYKVVFGMHAIPQSGQGNIINIGDRVEVVRTTDKHFYIRGYE